MSRVPAEYGPCPRPEKPVRGTADAKRYMAAVAGLPCCVCGARPVECHHPIMGRFAQRKTSDMDVVPLCPTHHSMLHRSPDFWREFYGFDTDHIETTRKAVEQLKE